MSEWVTVAIAAVIALFGGGGIVWTFRKVKREDGSFLMTATKDVVQILRDELTRAREDVEYQRRGRREEIQLTQLWRDGANKLWNQVNEECREDPVWNPPGRSV